MKISKCKWCGKEFEDACSPECIDCCDNKACVKANRKEFLKEMFNQLK